MNSPGLTELGSASANEPMSESTHERTPERGRSNGMPFIFWVLEQRLPTLLAVPTLIALGLMLATDGGWPVFVISWFAVPLVLVVFPLMLLIVGSRIHDAGNAHWDEFVAFRDEKQQRRWLGKKIPMEILYEAYVGGQLDFKRDVYEVLLRRNSLFRFCFTWGDIKFYFKQFLGTNLSHSKAADEGDIAHVYNRGNDFYRWFLGESMVYTCGIFRSPDESLEVAQERKLETICKSVQMKPGDRHLDIGCGWGTLLVHSASKYGAHCTGVTLAKEQAEFANERARQAGVGDRVQILVDDYRNLPAASYDKITCVEMAEHVGIKNFQKFLLQVSSLLKDDGIFYLQIAGLRRAWQYEDLVWGLFMAKYVFPGADASCPLGFVVSQAERAGFEVHRVENTGAHYGLTIRKWYDNWLSNEAAIVAKYGQRWFRLWTMFLGWSVLIGGQGSSTLFMLTLTKNTKNDKSTVDPESAKAEAFSRADRWIGPDPVATQQ